MNDGRQVLVVDDDWPMAEKLVDILNLKGFRAEGANIASGAPEMVGSAEFGCVLTDVRMPAVKGVELLKAGKATRPRLPSVLMTAHGRGNSVHEGLRDGAIASLSKPIDIDLLVWFLSEICCPQGIVIVDDDPQSWRTAKEVLRGHGLLVQSVRDSHDLMQVLRPSGQVVFLGARLECRSGLELLTKIRARYQTLPVVMTFDGREQAFFGLEGARGPGADAYLRKPFEMEELLEVLVEVRQREVAALLHRCPDTLVCQHD